ncbi:MAG: NADH-quinone oxidoreductase subunit N, partial [Pedobacter sp.]|nr:NADH-quinone oxidoreductase subunit N [Pedobacter sp.]
MNALITLSILAILVLYLGLYKAKNALLPVTLLGLAAGLVLAVLEWNSGAAPIYSGMMQFDNFAVAFTSIGIVSTMLILLISKDYFEHIS